MAALRYFDVVLIAVAAPIMLLIDVSATGYLVGAGAWIALRAAGVAVDRYASALTEPRHELPLRLAHMIGRLFLLAIAVIVARSAGGRDAGLAALAVIVFAFTVALVISFADRPGRR